MARDLDFSALPVVGREDIQRRLLTSLQSALEGRGRIVLVTGERGTGKTHLCRYLGSEAERRGFSVATGQAYQVERGVPYALFSDTFLPLLRAQPPEALTVLSRGGNADLEQLFPGLTRSPSVRGTRLGAETPGETRARVLWTFTEVLRGMAERTPLCLVLEDTHWADPSSLEAIHFIARHLADSPALLLLTRASIPKGDLGPLAEIERSLLAQPDAEEVFLPTLNRRETGILLNKAFGVEEEAVGGFADHLHAWTQGNPFFLEETLKSLVRSGGLYRKGEAWLGWEIRELALPRTVREAVLERLSRLPEKARNLAELVATCGGRTPFTWLRILSPLSETELLEELDLLVEREVLTESLGDDGVFYDFQQTLVRETMEKELGLARSQVLHRRIAEALEESFGIRASEHAAILAYHHLRSAGEGTPNAILHLVKAGRDALARFGDTEATGYLRAALNLMDRRESRGDKPVGIEGGRRKVLVDLARALSRTGEYAEAIPLWTEARKLAEKEGALDEAGECRRRIGIIRSYSGDPRGAVEEYDKILASPESLSPTLLARTRLRRGVALEELGELEEAREEMESVLLMAEELQDPVILAQAHRALVLLHIWTGHPDRVRVHAGRAMQLAKESGALGVEFWTHWGLAVLEGLLGDTRAMAVHVAEANRVAQELRSPVLALRSAELAIEEASATGQWDSGIAIGEQAIALARSLSQNTILPRLLIWTALIYINRGETELARPLIEEAWEVSGAGQGSILNVHGEIPAYIGMGYLALKEEDFKEAIRLGQAALEIADRAGYGLWAIHRLVPLLAEAYLWDRDLEGARVMGERLRSGSSGIQHRLGLAWAQSCEALLTWLEGDPGEGARLMEEAAQALEEIPMIGDAARLRRMKAGRLADVGDRKGSLEELAKVHEIFLRLGAEVELERTRTMFRALDARPPRRTATGDGELSTRELEIARLVEARKSNKAIARALGISPRTVSTHLSNIYQKLEIGSRGELADYVRSEGLSEL